MTPGATSISRSSATMSHSRTPPDDRALVEVAQDRVWVEAVRRGVHPAHRAAVVGAVVRGAVVRDGGRGGGGAVEALVRDQLVQHRHGAGGRGPAEQLAPRNPMLPQLAHWLPLKHILGMTKTPASAPSGRMNDAQLTVASRLPAAREEVWAAGDHAGGRERRADADRADDAPPRRDPARPGERSRGHADRALLDPAVRARADRLGRPDARAPGPAERLPRALLDAEHAHLGARAHARADAGRRLRACATGCASSPGSRFPPARCCRSTGRSSGIATAGSGATSGDT